MFRRIIPASSIATFVATAARPALPQQKGQRAEAGPIDPNGQSTISPRTPVPLSSNPNTASFIARAPTVPQWAAPFSAVPMPLTQQRAAFHASTLMREQQTLMQHALKSAKSTAAVASEKASNAASVAAEAAKSGASSAAEAARNGAVSLGKSVKKMQRAVAKKGAQAKRKAQAAAPSKQKAAALKRKAKAAVPSKQKAAALKRKASRSAAGAKRGAAAKAKATRLKFKKNSQLAKRKVKQGANKAKKAVGAK